MMWRRAGHGALVVVVLVCACITFSGAAALLEQPKGEAPVRARRHLGIAAVQWKGRPFTGRLRRSERLVVGLRGGQRGRGYDDGYGYADYAYDDGYDGYEEPGYYEDDAGEGQWGEYDTSPPPRKAGRKKASRGDKGIAGLALGSTLTEGNKKWGMMAVAGSMVVTMMGISLFFNKMLMRLGNMMFVAGVSLLIGPSRVVRYFTRKSKLRGTIIFGVGFFLVFTGHPIIGLVLEVFGFMNLFGNMLPMVGAMARSMPIVRDIIPSSGTSSRKRSATKRASSSRSSRPPPRRADFQYYDDEYPAQDEYYDDRYPQ